MARRKGTGRVRPSLPPCHAGAFQRARPGAEVGGRPRQGSQAFWEAEAWMFPEASLLWDASGGGRQAVQLWFNLVFSSFLNAWPDDNSWGMGLCSSAK